MDNNNLTDLFSTLQGAPNQPQQSKADIIDDNITKQRAHWLSVIKEMNDNMQTMPKVDELLNSVYIKRQNAVDYYYAMNTVILRQSRIYKASYNNMFNNIKLNGYNGMRFTSDQAIARQVETDLQEHKEIIDLLTNQSNFMKETIQTIDNIIYGINQKVKVHAMLNGLNSI